MHDQSRFVYTEEELLSILCDPSKEVKDIRVVNKNLAHVQWSSKSGMEQPSNYAVYIAAITTAQCRLKLLNVMRRLSTRCVYHDTGVYYIIGYITKS